MRRKYRSVLQFPPPFTAITPYWRMRVAYNDGDTVNPNSYGYDDFCAISGMCQNAGSLLNSEKGGAEYAPTSHAMPRIPEFYQYSNYGSGLDFDIPHRFSKSIILGFYDF